MAYIDIKENKKGMLVAKIQISGKDPTTDENKIYSKRIYNEESLTPAKFRRFVEKAAIEFEEEVEKQYESGVKQICTRVLTFDELATEWITNIEKNFSRCYYSRAVEAVSKFNTYLKKRHLFKSPISDITVRDVQLFVNSMETYTRKETAQLKKTLPDFVNFRELDRLKIINRNTSYLLNNKKRPIALTTAKAICEHYGLHFDTYFDITTEERPYSAETVKGTRRIIRTIFNEAIRYEWITKNPVVLSKVGGSNGNVSLKPVKEKEVFSEREAKAFLKRLDELSDEFINRKICLKLLLLTGLRIGELNGLKWSDIDYVKKVVHVRRNRLYDPKLGYYEKEPKTKTSTRDIPIPEALIKDLQHYENWFRIADSKFDFKLDQYYLASTIYRKPVAVSTVANWLKYYQSEWDTKRVTCHGMRHTYCSLLLLKNVPIQTVSKYMGHSDSTVTLKVYSHFIPESQDKVIYVLNNLIEGGEI